MASGSSAAECPLQGWLWERGHCKGLSLASVQCIQQWLPASSWLYSCLYSLGREFSACYREDPGAGPHGVSVRLLPSSSPSRLALAQTKASVCSQSFGAQQHL